MKPNPTQYSIWRLCAASAFPYMLFGLFGFSILAGNLPPAPQYLTAAQITQHYLDHNLAIRAGMAMALFAMPIYMVFSSAVSRAMTRIEGQGGVLSQIELMGGMGTIVAGVVGFSAWLAASFRTETRSPEVIQALNDFGWIAFNCTYMVTTLQQFAVGIVFLSDKRARPLIPGWVCYFSFLSGTVFLALSLMTFFNDGPFAWHGLINFWVSLGGYFVWVLLLAIYLLKAIGRLQDEEARQGPLGLAN